MTVLKAINLQESIMIPAARSGPRKDSIETNSNSEIKPDSNGAAVTGSPRMPEMHVRPVEGKETDPAAVATELANRIESIKNLPDENGEKLTVFSQCAKELESIHPKLLPRLVGSLMATMPYLSKADASRSSFTTMVELSQLFLQDPAKKAAAVEIFSTLPAMLANLPLKERTEVFVCLKNTMNQQLNKLKEEHSASLASNIHSMLASLYGAVNILCPSVRDELQKELSHCINEYAEIPEHNAEDRSAPLLRKAEIENAARSYSVLLG